MSVKEEKRLADNAHDINGHVDKMHCFVHVLPMQVGLDQQTVTVVCTNRRRKFLLDTADTSLTS